MITLAILLAITVATLELGNRAVGHRHQLDWDYHADYGDTDMLTFDQLAEIDIPQAA